MTASQQIALFDITDTPDPRDVHGRPDLLSYDYYVLAFSAGKDSVASYLSLLEAGIPAERIELWHHLVDGREGSNLFDWPVTEAYVNAFGAAFGSKVYHSWKEAGLEGEMNRTNALTRPTWFETPDGTFKAGGLKGKLSTRRRFPQQAADLSVRWCSGVAKIDVAAMAIANQTRFAGKRTLFVTGERAEESSNRANYLSFEPHRKDTRNGRTKRHIDHWRPVHHFSEAEVWAIIQRHGVLAHPAYRMGFGRLSCMKCIFASANQWATIQFLDPEGFNKVADYEDESGCTIHRERSVRQQAALGTVYEGVTQELAAVAMSTEYSLPIKISPEEWTLPAGAYGESAGPN